MASPPPVKPTDRRMTPDWLAAGVRGFLRGAWLDPCTEPHNPMGAGRFYAYPAGDGLAAPWQGDVYVNPPFSRIRVWVLKGVVDVLGGCCERLLLLTPADFSTRWWSDLENSRHAVARVDLSRRLRCIGPDKSAPEAEWREWEVARSASLWYLDADPRSADIHGFYECFPPRMGFFRDLR